ncbi:hypothetical protein ACFQBQ_00715 [Granulicella cerasi]|uniref:Uncharacterized protein n=1 Tax=Granulicella cerasi TaxID=741063 RepID=A0ABW1Z4T8_9BACT|nr:hypothetical protein [Granulicella cerasi]
MRNLSTAMRAALTARVLRPAILIELTFKSGTYFVHTGIGQITWNGNTYLGVGSLGKVGTITENTTVEAAGTTLTLTGVDPTLYADCMTDIVTGLPARILLACLSGSTVIDALVIFSGLVDQPTITENSDDITVTLALENALTNLQRPHRSLYTAVDQRMKWPNDNGFDWITSLIDTANTWG